MDLDSLFFRVARLESYNSSSRIRVGACLAKNRKLISYGHNSDTKTHPAMLQRGYSWGYMHAELAAIIGVHKTDLRGAHIYVYREKGNGSLGLSRPCPRCQVILRAAGISMAYYTDPASPSGWRREKL